MSPTDPSYVNGCRGKAQYRTKREAKHALRVTRTYRGAMRVAGKGPLSVYRCSHCGHFHLGHPRIYPRQVS